MEKRTSRNVAVALVTAVVYAAVQVRGVDSVTQLQLGIAMMSEIVATTIHMPWISPVLVVGLIGGPFAIVAQGLYVVGHRLTRSMFVMLLSILAVAYVWVFVFVGPTADFP